MAEKAQAGTRESDGAAVPAADASAGAAPGAAPAAPRRNASHRGTDVRDTVAELAARAHEISLEAGSKVAAAMKDVIGAAAGLTGFAVESARDLVQYMIRRGQMTQEEGDKLLREAEEAYSRKQGGAAAPAARATPPAAVEPAKDAAAEPKPVTAQPPGGSKSARKATAKAVADGAAKDGTGSHAKAASQAGTTRASGARAAAGKRTAPAAKARTGAAKKKK